MCGLAGLMIIGMYVGIFFIIFYGLKINKFNKDKDSIRLNNTDDSDCGFKVLPSIDQSIVIEKHTILAKINKMISVCENQLRQLKVESSKDYQLKRELETVINSYDEIRKIEINDRTRGFNSMRRCGNFSFICVIHGKTYCFSKH